MSHERIQPLGWAKPKGYSNGVLAQPGRLLAVAGQVGWNAQQVFERADFLGQFDQALANFVAVVSAAGGGAEHVISMTIYCPDLDAYHASTAELGPVWRQHMGRTYPAMALVGVAGLVDAPALVEIQGLAVIPQEDP